MRTCMACGRTAEDVEFIEIENVKYILCTNAHECIARFEEQEAQEDRVEFKFS